LRRLASYLIDLLLLAAPWTAAAGMFAAPARGNWISGLAAFAAVALFACTGSVVLLVLQCVLFLSRGRTLGMALTGLVVVRGIRWLALLLDPVLLVAALVVAFPVGVVLSDKGVLSDDVTTAMLPLSPVAAMAINLLFLMGPQRRTLTDRIAGLRVAPSTSADPSPPASRRGAYAIDAAIAAAVGAPVVLGAGGSQLLGAALGSAFALILLGAAELALWRRTGATLGMRALNQRARFSDENRAR
jgi:uncharacterized RDD family membrane protein YckC